MITTLVLTALAVAVLYGRYRWRVWVLTRAERRRLTAHAAARAQKARRRPWAQRLHETLPDQLICRLMRHRAQPRGRLVRIARRGPGYGRFEKINPAQHVLCVGMTGSGKSSTLRVLADWAKRRPDWLIEVWDGKFGASGAPYRPHGSVLVAMDHVEERLADLVTRELPARAQMAERPHRVIVIDESRIFNSLSASGMRDLVTVIQEGRELGVHLWVGIQDPKTSSVPSEIRDQFSCRLIHMVQTAEAAQVALKELATAGYEPHRLQRAGQLLIHEKGRRHPSKPVFALWLAPSRLALTPGRVCMVKVPPLPVAVAPLPTRVTRRNTHATPPGNITADTFAVALEHALLDGPHGVRELARLTGRNPGSVLRKLTTLAAHGVVERTPNGTYTLTAAPEEPS
ncbi:helix-turn-helix domain-containing protein [Streptomyces sp. NPDC001928]|uniref:HVO_A0114 family putative DNA-binding protein n=1 Tax=Streptomyces sp. NPDC001928 TaxID=3154404 RepID=UPI003316EA33